MAANNNNNNAGGAGAGRQGNNQMNEHVEFSVKAEEDLYLTGSENTIRRVTAETNYSCLMLKTQRFSSLFRHYAKYHGLRKDDLEYYFVNLLENEDTPESVQLQRGDTIMVRKRRKPEPPQATADDDEYFKDMRELLTDDEHMDCSFVIRNCGGGMGGGRGGGLNGMDGAVGGFPAKVASSSSAGGFGGGGANASSSSSDTTVLVRAHKSILTARSDYFKALFRNHQFRESATCEIPVDSVFTAQHLKYVLEFLYTNRIADIREVATDDLLCLLHLSDKWQLRDLKRLVEFELVRDHMNCETVARLYGATEDFQAQRLSRACIDFIMSNLRQLAGNVTFEEEMKNYPHLCIPVLKAAADLIPDGPLPKKQRLSQQAPDNATPSSTAALGSSPVPDSDT